MELEQLDTPEEMAGLARATQYACYTPEFIVRALWNAVKRMGGQRSRAGIDRRRTRNIACNSLPCVLASSDPSALEEWSVMSSAFQHA
jgi:hypothetical protein